MAVSLMSFRTTSEGESAPNAFIAIGRTVDTNGAGLYASFMLPVPVYQMFERFEDGCFYEGWRCLRFYVRIRRNKQGKWFWGAHKYMHAITQKLIATREMWEDQQLDADTQRKVNLVVGKF